MEGSPFNAGPIRPIQTERSPVRRAVPWRNDSAQQHVFILLCLRAHVRGGFEGVSGGAGGGAAAGDRGALPKISILLVPYLERANGRERSKSQAARRLYFDREAAGGQDRTSTQLADGGRNGAGVRAEGSGSGRISLPVLSSAGDADGRSLERRNGRRLRPRAARGTECGRPWRSGRTELAAEASPAPHQGRARQARRFANTRGNLSSIR